MVEKEEGRGYNAMKEKIIALQTFRAIITYLKQISRDTKDRGDMLNRYEYLEITRLILDRLSADVGPIDYASAEAIEGEKEEAE